MPFAPGALNDIVARLLSDVMGKTLGQPVIVENLTGADGTIATNRVARSTPDGYTIIVGNWNTQVANSLIYSLQYDMTKDFEPVMLLPAAPMVLVAKKATPATDLKSFVAWLKANPDKAFDGHRRRRQSAAHAGAVVPATHRDPVRSHSLSRRGTGDAGRHRRPDRRHLYHGGAGSAADRVGQPQGFWADGAKAHGRGGGHPDHG